MLIYHPAFDAYHCLVRFCAILDRVQATEFDRLRILDFCLCFPTSVLGFKLPRSALSLRAQAKAVENPYRTPIGQKRVFDDLDMIHEASLGCLTAAGVVEVDSYRIRRTNRDVPPDFFHRCQRLQAEERFFFEDCLPVFGEMSLLGVDGLKSRSGLLEYRYDAA